MTYDLKTSHLAKQDGAKQEDGIEKQQAQAQPPVQPPVVQMDTRHLVAAAGRTSKGTSKEQVEEFSLCITTQFVSQAQTLVSFVMDTSSHQPPTKQFL